MPREPGYRLHKPTGQAYVYLSGRMFYLGKHGTPESREKYERLKAEWLKNRHAGKFAPISSLTMAQVCLAYLDHAEEYYAQSSEYEQLRLTVKPISELYSMCLASEFGPLEFKTVRGWWLEREVKTGKGKDAKEKPPRRCSRQYCNKQMKRLLRIIKWAVSSGMMPADKYTAIKCIEPLKAGRCAAPEAEPVKCVPQELVDATLPHLTTVLADMVRFQQLTGCRPGELCGIKPNMVDRSADVWTICLSRHKTAHRGKSRTIYVGPQAQAVLSPYLLRRGDAYCFSPIESERQRRQAAHEARVTRLSCGNRPGSNLARKPRKQPGKCYTAHSYARAITYACNRGKLEQWAPNQLRHNAATKVRKKFGLDAASVILGHSGLEVTQVYAEADRQKAIEVARKIG